MRFPLVKSLLTFIAAVSCVSILWGQSVYWSPSSGTLQQGKSNAIDLFYDSCQPDGQPELPKIEGIELRFRGQSSSTNIINGRRSSKVILNYQAIPLRQGTLTLPSIRVKTSSGEIQVPPARFEVVEATVGNTGVSPDDVFISLFQNRDEKIYTGEVFELEYVAGAKEEYQLDGLSTPEWNPTEIVTSGLVDGQVSRVTYQESPYLIKLYTAKAIATTPGIKKLPSATQEATVIIGRRRNIFQEAVYDAFTIESDPFALEILPLPEGAPESFKGAVGDFELESRVVPEEVQVGEPVTWTLELKGVGNWPAGIGVPARSVSSRFKAIQPEIKNDFSDDDLFTGSQSEDIVLIPTETGSFEFGPLQYTYFDPKEERYKTIQIPSKTITVTPATTQSPGAAPIATDPDNIDSPSPSSEAYDLAPTGQNVFEKRPELLKEPKNSITETSVPEKRIGLLLPTSIALAAPLCCWFLLAFLRSFSVDPKKQERKALRDLRRIARTTAPTESEALKKHHLQWRNAASRYFALSSKEPTPEEIHAAAKALKSEDFASNWLQAWRSSDQTLFGIRPADPSEWNRLQKIATGMCPSKNYTPAGILRFRSWIPAIALCGLILISPSDLIGQESQATAGELYQQGKFSAAAAQWTTTIADEPNVFEHRYNAGLAYAQTGDWSRAWAYWTSAYCLEPNNEEIAWNIRIAHQNTPSYDPVLQSLITGDGLYKIVRLRSPAGWQQLSIQSIWAMGSLLFLAIAALYIRPLRRASSYLLVLSLISGVFAYFSQWSHSKYEALGDPDSILVVAESPLLTIPTDLQTEQVSSTVGGGTIVKQERAFLGWIKIQLPNGESGWLRKENVLPLYGAPSQL